jgi:hypothetical protein
MKIKNAKKNEVTLKDAFKIGDLLKISRSCFDGRGGYDSYKFKVKLTKINKVTADGVDVKSGDEIRLDYEDLCNAKIIEVEEVTRKNLLRA